VSATIKAKDKMGVLPILFEAAICLTLTSSVVTPGLSDVIQPYRQSLRRDRTFDSPAHSPCSQLHARLAGCITTSRWWALTPPFHPLPL